MSTSDDISPAAGWITPKHAGNHPTNKQQQSTTWSEFFARDAIYEPSLLVKRNSIEALKETQVAITSDKDKRTLDTWS